MYTTWRTRLMAESWYKHATGKTFQEEMDEKLAEKEAILKEAILKEAILKEAILKEAILAMYREAKFSAEKIALILELELPVVNNIIEAAAV